MPLGMWHHTSLGFAHGVIVMTACGILTTTACQSTEDQSESNTGGAGNHPPDGSGGLVLGAGGSGSTGAVSSLAGSNAGGACASAQATAEPRPVRLAVLFDASGSMGELDYPWHDPEVKWEPVVAATNTFLTSPDSVGVEASMTLFPSLEDRCDPGQYDTPQIPFTELPSPVFGELLDTIVPDRGGTPTWAVLASTIDWLLPLVEEDSETSYAIVLVSDGYPQGCSDDDDMDVVSAEVAAVADTIPTYVIGVRNPPVEDAPDNVTNLHQIAEAGGTETAFLIDTGDPEQTHRDFLAAINGIRGQSLSCNLGLPAPPAGRELDPRRVNVIYESGDATTPLGYSVGCSDANSWHYDDPDHPTEIRLCDATCATMKADPRARLDIEFACDLVIPELY